MYRNTSVLLTCDQATWPSIPLTLTLYSGPNTLATNDRWEEGDNPDAVAAAGKAVGAFALAPNSEDAALLLTLPPGAYTVEVKGNNGAEGLALFEIYDVP